MRLTWFAALLAVLVSTQASAGRDGLRRLRKDLAPTPATDVARREFGRRFDPRRAIPDRAALAARPAGAVGEPIPAVTPILDGALRSAIAPNVEPVALRVASGRGQMYRENARRQDHGQALLRMRARNGTLSSVFLAAPTADDVLLTNVLAHGEVDDAGFTGSEWGSTVLRMKSGDRAIFRRTLGDYNAYRADRMLGLGFVPPTILAALPGEQEVGSLQLFVDAEPAGVETGRGAEARVWNLGDAVSKGQRANAQVFDVLTRGAAQRTGMKFGVGRHMGRSQLVLWGNRGTRFDQTDATDHAAVAVLGQIGRGLFTKLRTLTPRDVEAALGASATGFIARQGEIVAHFDGLIARYGEAAVLVDD